MRRAAFLILSMLALAACNPSTSATSTTSATQTAPGGLPDMFVASYRSEATISDPNTGRATQIIQYHDGHKLRMEVAGTATVIDRDAQQAFTLAEMRGKRVAMRVPMTAATMADSNWFADGGQITRGGDCSGAGLEGTEYIHVDANDQARYVGCVTSDGILLSSKKNDQVVWQTTSVQRGHQDAALFTVPEGVEVMDMSNIPGLSDAMEKYRARQQHN